MIHREKLVIACQGGGSHTIFTAGVLAAFFQAGIHQRYQIVGISGTSGGGVCALLAWYGLLKAAHGSKDPVEKPLIDLWADNTALLPHEQILNDLAIHIRRIEDAGLVPSFPVNPAAAQCFSQLCASLSPRPEFFDLPTLLRKHVDFDALKTLIQPDSPLLHLGAVNVQSGQFQVFSSSSRKFPISLPAVLATTAVPYIFPAVEMDGQFYWDGLFAENPPILKLVSETKPKHLWVLCINPDHAPAVPRTEEAIIDRTNELSGNISLTAALDSIRQFNRFYRNRFLDRDFVLRNRIQFIRVHELHLTPHLADQLDYASKLDRNPALMNTLFQEGQTRARLFLQDLNIPVPKPTPTPQPARA